MASEVKKLTVIGGVNIDICGTPSHELKMRDSNPGEITMRPGGVGGNIAHDIRLLGMDVSLITALGGDGFAQIIREDCRECGIDISHSRTVKDARSSVYMYVKDERGDMCVAVNDMEIVRYISPLFLAMHINEISRSDAVVIDANLSHEAIEYLCKHCSAPIYADPVSEAKAVKLIQFLPCFAGIKPNFAEARVLTGENTPIGAAHSLLRQGVKRVFISMGADGILGAEGDELTILPAPGAAVVNTTGAGDAVSAVLAVSGALDLDLTEALHCAALAGAITTETENATNPELSFKAVFEQVL